MRETRSLKDRYSGAVLLIVENYFRAERKGLVTRPLGWITNAVNSSEWTCEPALAKAVIQVSDSDSAKFYRERITRDFSDFAFEAMRVDVIEALQKRGLKL